MIKYCLFVLIFIEVLFMLKQHNLTSISNQASPEYLLYQIGYVRLVAQKEDDNTYRLYTTYKGQEVMNSALEMEQEDFDELVAKAEEGASSLINDLKCSGLTAFINAIVLQLEQNRTTKNDPLASFKSRSDSLAFQIGSTSLIVEKMGEKYELFTIPNEQIASIMVLHELTPKIFDELVAKANEGASSLINYLQTRGKKGNKHASVLEKALQQNKETGFNIDNLLKIGMFSQFDASESDGNPLPPLMDSLVKGFVGFE